MKMLRLAVVAMSAYGLVACNAGPNRTNIELITNMMDQPSVKSQDWSPVQGDQLQMRTPPEGTVARGHAAYAYAKDFAGAQKQANPLAGNMSAETLTVGRQQYDIYCAVCHNGSGDGNGPVAAKMGVKPRNLIAADALAYTDGRIYHAITAGYGVMGAYATQITDAKKRWAVVNYVRSLQKQVK